MTFLFMPLNFESSTDWILFTVLVVAGIMAIYSFLKGLILRIREKKGG